MAKYLATFSDTINDVEITGFIVMTDKEVETYEELATSITWEFEYSIDGNEDPLYYSTGEDLLTRIDFREITNEDYKAIKKVFDGKFGIFIDEEFLEQIGHVDDEIDEEEDEDNSEDYPKLGNDYDDYD